ncbi:hypothetical protein AVEN_84473-1 [Araneus ventricosus]|uniref:Uncharacterized protein n=1 Tax=Araneus ventricosus TaxID=182803 RepID=A0A4Y2KED0_ARAVE|nr:hypothetical protein AVEN_84473-1 [Araneus ventricosus]
MCGGRLRMSLTITSATADVSSDLQLSCQHINMAGGIDAPAKCELRSVISFLQAEGWFVENDQCSCFLSDLMMTSKSHSDL